MTTTHLIETLTASGVRLSVADGKLKVDAPSGVLTEQHRSDIRAHKAGLIVLLTPKPCERCESPMLCIEAGYCSCPNCCFQTVEANSGFWVTGIGQELKEAATVPALVCIERER